MRTYPKSNRGFTLVEMIIVIVITGIIGGMVAMFIRMPVQGYVDSARRAEMTDIADTAMRRIARDLRSAVPNSVRVPNPLDSAYVEFLPTKDGGRYRVADIGPGGCGASGNELSFDAPDSCFEVVGNGISLVRGVDPDHSDQIVVGSTQSSGNLPYDKTTSGVRRPYTGATGVQTAIHISNVQLPAFAELPGSRFEVVPNDQQAVTYSCQNLGVDANGDGKGTLTRFWAYGFNPSPSASPGGTSALLADKVSDCHFVYDTSNVRNSLLSVRLTITRGGESVNLYQEIHINNIP